MIGMSKFLERTEATKVTEETATTEEAVATEETVTTEETVETEETAVTEETVATETVSAMEELTTEMAETKETTTSSGKTIGIIGIGVVLFAIIAALAFLERKKKLSKGKEQSADSPKETVSREQLSGEDHIGKLHNIGNRKSQQDSLGITETEKGIFAVVADGMGGLSDGDKVSQKIVMTMLQDAVAVSPSSMENRLFAMISHANHEVNRMLGIANQYKSGSTAIAVLTEEDGFHWVSVGDSRIYLYRGQRLIQLNKEHTYEADLLCQAINEEISFEEVKRNPKRTGLTSFVGMGELKHVDGSYRKLLKQKGDILLLMSDGVFNTLCEEEICQILSTSKNAKEMAEKMEGQVLSRQNPKQDNFTAVIIEL